MPTVDFIECVETHVPKTRSELIANRVCESHEHALPVAALSDTQQKPQSITAIEDLAKHGVP